MTEQSAEKKLLEAAGKKAPVSPTPADELLELRDRMNRCFEAMMTEAQKALASSQQTREATDEMFRRLQKYCNDSLPTLLEKAFLKLAEEELRGQLLPVEESARQLVSELEKRNREMICELQTCVRTGVSELEHARHQLVSASWRLYVVPGIMALLLVVVGVPSLGYYMYGEKASVARRFEHWGRKVYTKIGGFSPKDQAAMNRLFGSP